jgi:hypothetical protein
MKLNRLYIVLMFSSFYLYANDGYENRLFFGIGTPFCVPLGFQSERPFNNSNKLCLLTRGDFILISNTSFKNGNSISGCFILNLVPGLSYRYILSENVFIHPKIGPAINIYISPSIGSGPQFGFGIDPGIGIVFFKKFEMGIISNIAFSAPISFSNWISFEIGWSP